MQDVAGKGAFSRHFKKGLTADAVGGYLAAVEGLRELLKAHILSQASAGEHDSDEQGQVRDHSCGLMLEPFEGLGVDGTRNKVRSYFTSRTRY